MAAAAAEYGARDAYVEQDGTRLGFDEWYQRSRALAARLRFPHKIHAPVPARGDAEHTAQRRLRCALTEHAAEIRGAVAYRRVAAEQAAREAQRRAARAASEAQAAEQAWKHGVVVVAAAGNDGAV